MERAPLHMDFCQFESQEESVFMFLLSREVCTLGLFIHARL